jgi:hypothetical protein
MKKQTLSFTLAGILLSIGILSFHSCKKDSDDDDTNAAKYEATSELYFNEMNDLSDQVADKGNLSGFKTEEDQAQLLEDCALITIDTSVNVSESNPDTLIIDFGNGCAGSDGKTRAGRIVISATGKYRNPGTVVIIRSDNYSVDGNRVSGYRKITNTGPNSSGQPTASVEVDGSVELVNNGGTITWKANRFWTWTTGYTTKLILADDEVTLSGNSSGTGPNGGSWTTTINTPLLYKRICHQVVSGTLTITPASKPERFVDFGQGLCDGTIKVTINNKTYTIQVK